MNGQAMDVGKLGRELHIARCERIFAIANACAWYDQIPEPCVDVASTLCHGIERGASDSREYDLLEILNNVMWDYVQWLNGKGEEYFPVYHRAWEGIHPDPR